jgi:hypothetical protein
MLCSSFSAKSESNRDLSQFYFVLKCPTRMYNLFLTDDPSNWPWHAFINLPLIPLSLILSRTPVASNMLPIVPVLLSWPTSTPVASRERIVLSQWKGGLPDNPLSVSSTTTYGLGWPPAPGLLGLFVFPVVRALYKRYWSRLTHWVMETTPAQPAQNDQWRVGGGFPRVRVRFGGGPDPPQAQVQPQAPGGDANANANVNANPPADAAAIAEHTIHISGSSLGRLIGGALIIPEISNIMGSILFRLSAHSSLLRRFLAIRPRTLKVNPSVEWWMAPGTGVGRWDGLGIVGKLGLSLRLILGAWWGGSRTWAECDPVW